MTDTGPQLSHLDIATQLVTAVVADDTALVVGIMDALDHDDAVWVAVALANLVATYVGCEAKNTGKTPLDVWSHALTVAEAEAGT